MKQRNNYIDRNELHSEMQAYKDTGVISERLGQLFLTITTHILGHSNFRNYTQDVREEMRSHALLLLVKYSHNCDADERNARQTFNYITTIVMNAWKQVLIKYYKNQNMKRELEQRYIDILAQEYGISIKKDYIENFEVL